MSAPLVVMDVGDVLIRTVPMAHHRALARRAGLPWAWVAETIEGSGIVAGFETGRISAAEFVDEVRGMLGCPSLRAGDVRTAWNAVVAEVDPMMAAVAARLAAAGRLVLASNTNPFHWRATSRRLATVGVVAPACLSFAIGFAKPDSAFFATLTDTYLGARRTAVYVDDRPDHVEAAVRHGLTAWLHRDAARTMERLTDPLR